MKSQKQTLKPALSAAAAVAAALTVAVGTAQARPSGLDVSSYQGAPGWGSVAGAGYSFAWAKATEGTYDQDGDYTYNMSNGKSSGLYMGAYHFARPDLDSPSTEGNYFWGFAGSYIKNDGKSSYPMLDYETFNGVVGASGYTSWANTWFNTVFNSAANNNVVVKPVIYISACNGCDVGGDVGNWIDWIANYNGESSQTGSPWSVCTSCDIWGGWNLWQWTSSGSVPGISGSVDLDVFNGTSAGFVSQCVISTGGTGGQVTYSNYVGPIEINTDGTLEMFMITNNTPAHEYQTSANGSWGGLYTMGGISGIPAISSIRNKDGRLEIFCANNSDTIYHNYQTAPHSAWSGWISMSGTGTNLQAVVNKDGRDEVFCIGSDGYIWHKWQTNTSGAWNSSWSSMGGQKLKPGYVVAQNSDGRLEIFGVSSSNNDVWHNYQTAAGLGWNGWIDLGGNGINPRLAFGQDTDGRLEIFGVGPSGDIQHNYQYKGGGGAWNGWGSMGGTGCQPGFVCGMNIDGRLELFCVQTSNNDVWHKYQNVAGGAWTDWYDFGGNNQDPQLVVANNANGAMQVFGIGKASKTIWTNYQSNPGGTWNGWFNMYNAGAIFYPGQP